MISWLLLGPRLRDQTAGLKSVTIPTILISVIKARSRGPFACWPLATILFATLWYMAGIAKGCAHLLETVLDIPYALGRRRHYLLHLRLHRHGRGCTAFSGPTPCRA